VETSNILFANPPQWESAYLNNGQMRYRCSDCRATFSEPAPKLGQPIFLGTKRCFHELPRG